MVQQVNESTTSSIPSVSKDNIVDWIVNANTKLTTQSSCVAKSFKVCGISNTLNGSENGLLQCAKELPNFKIPFRMSADESDEDIFANTDDKEESNEEDEQDNEEDDKQDDEENNEQGDEYNVTVCKHYCECMH